MAPLTRTKSKLPGCAVRVTPAGGVLLASCAGGSIIAQSAARSACAICAQRSDESPTLGESIPKNSCPANCFSPSLIRARCSVVSDLGAASPSAPMCSTQTPNAMTIVHATERAFSHPPDGTNTITAASATSPKIIIHRPTSFNAFAPANDKRKLLAGFILASANAPLGPLVLLFGGVMLLRIALRK